MDKSIATEDNSSLLSNISDINDIYLTLPENIQRQQLALTLSSTIILNICIFFMLLIIIFLIIEFCNPSSQLQSSYFYLIFFGFVLFSLCTIIQDVTGAIEGDIKALINNSIRWYLNFDLACWNTFLAMNRASALAFPTKYEKFWGKELTIVYSVFIFIFPFLVDGRSILDICFWKGYTKECASFQLSDQWFCSIWNITLAFFSLFLTLISISYSKKNGYTATKKVETRLMLQTAFSSTMIVLSSCSQLLSVIYYRNKSKTMFVQYAGLSEIITGAYFCPVIIVLFFASSLFRNNFLRFYRLNRFVLHGRTVRVTQSTVETKFN
uniref:Serpentine receptor class gamma n=1 Tax=Panagrolaimus sp. PS1159 TaxID=55785 RepID=A0AC35FF90_9BILA